MRIRFYVRVSCILVHLLTAAPGPERRFVAMQQYDRYPRKTGLVRQLSAKLSNGTWLNRSIPLMFHATFTLSVFAEAINPRMHSSLSS